MIFFETATGRWWLPVDVPTDFVIQAMREGLIYDQGIVSLAEKHIRPGTAALDVGTNFGQMSVLFSHLVGSAGVVHSFEAEPFVGELVGREERLRIDFRPIEQELVVRNLRENGCANVVFHPGAVWCEEGRSLYYPEPDFRRFACFGSYGIDPTAISSREL